MTRPADRSQAKPNPAELDFSAVTWEKSPSSGDNDNCVEFGVIGDLLAVRDSKRPRAGPTRLELAPL
ncbi:DUF397 domain-containing protein [Streptomyces microflavus]|uniref:DUF397 domain-containing protein n=1 Tax=Streptomyces microflavus TaxID=1919 RepID=UPI0033B2AA46